MAILEGGFHNPILKRDFNDHHGPINPIHHLRLILGAHPGSPLTKLMEFVHPYKWPKINGFPRGERIPISVELWDPNLYYGWSTNPP